MFWELYQQGRIAGNAKLARRAGNKADRSVRRMEDLEQKIAGLALASQALWELLREKTDLVERDLLNKMEEIDLRDGRRDGRMSATSDTCPTCGRKTSRRRPTCLYCGVEKGKGEIFG